MATGIFFSCATDRRTFSGSVEIDGEEVDGITAIKMLAPELCKDEPSAEKTGIFLSVYPSELEPLLSSVQNDVRFLIDSFTEESGAASQRQAIRNRFLSLPSGAFITDDPRIQKLFSDCDKVLSDFVLLQEIQSLIDSVPEKITVTSDGKKKNYEIERLSGDFESSYLRSQKALSELYYDVAEIQFSGKTPEARIRLFELFDMGCKLSGENPGLARSVRMSRLAAEIGDDFLGMADFEDREKGLEWYKTSLGIYEDYPKTSQKVALISFELGRDMLEAAKIEESESRKSELLEKSVLLLEAAGKYKGATELLEQALELRNEF